MQILHQSYDLFATTLSLATCYKVHWKCSKTTLNFTSASLVAVDGSRDGTEEIDGTLDGAADNSSVG